MGLISVTARNFRCYESVAADIGTGVTVVSGPNGAGKTNLLEALYFGCTGRSCRTASDREVVRFGADVARVTVVCADRVGRHELAVGFSPGQPKRMTADGAPTERLLDVPFRPLLSVFLPDRLELVKGVPALRRAHLDQVIAALWPSRVLNRRAYSSTLAQRNALIAGIRSGRASSSSFDVWDEQLAVAALAVMSDRLEATALIAGRFGEMARGLGLDGETRLDYRPRSHARTVDGFVAELAERRASDLERGFTGHGPHRDDLVMRNDGRELRTYGSQGQQRIGLLALLLAERGAIGESRGEPPMMLLDDVMSELDRQRRAALVERLRDQGGQALITTTDREQVPGAGDSATARIAVSGGRLLQDAQAA